MASVTVKKSVYYKFMIPHSYTKCLKSVYAKDEKHKYLVDNTKARSLADPW